MKFDFDKYKDQKVVMHCKTEEEAKDFCRVMDEAGMKWDSGTSYEYTTQYSIYKQDTCYCFNEGLFSDTDWWISEGYKILEWSDFMNKQFTKSDLRNGDVLVKRNGCVEIAIPGVGARITESGGQNFLNTIKEDLTDQHERNFDIIKVYRPKYPYQCSFKKCGFKDGELVFDREAIGGTVELTLKDIAELKGVSVDRIKIVNG